MVGYNPSRTGYSPLERGPASGVTEQWRVELDGQGGVPPAVHDGTVYAGPTSYVAAFDAATGDEQWRFESPERVSSPAVVDETVFVADRRRGNLHALDAASGEEQWSADAYTSGRSLTVHDGVVYAGLGAVSAEDGEELWTVETETGNGEMAVADGTVVIGTGDPSGQGFDGLIAVSTDDGSEQWRHELPGRVDSPPAIADGTVYATTGTDSTDSLFAFSLADGSQQWSADAGGPLTTPAVADGTVYTIGDSRYAFDAETGDQQWVEYIGTGTSPAVADGVVYAGTSAYSASDGSELWQHDTEFGSAGWVAPVGGTVYVCSRRGELYALS
jgi:outer membrane protein assembly factor BamB